MGAIKGVCRECYRKARPCEQLRMAGEAQLPWECGACGTAQPAGTVTQYVQQGETLTSACFRICEECFKAKSPIEEVAVGSIVTPGREPRKCDWCGGLYTEAGHHVDLMDQQGQQFHRLTDTILTAFEELARRGYDWAELSVTDGHSRINFEKPDDTGMGFELDLD